MGKLHREIPVLALYWPCTGLQCAMRIIFAKFFWELAILENGHTAILYRASTGPEQGFPCEVFHTGKNLFSLQGTPVLIAGTPVFITGISLWENFTGKTLFSLQGMGLQCTKKNTNRAFVLAFYPIFLFLFWLTKLPKTKIGCVIFCTMFFVCKARQARQKWKMIKNKQTNYYIIF